MKVQHVDAVVEAVDVGLLQQPVPQRQSEVVGSAEGEGRRITPPAREGDQSHGKIRGLSDSGHHPSDERKGWKRIYVQVVPRMPKRIVEDRLGMWDEVAV